MSIKTSQVFLIILCALLVGGLYYFGNTKTPLEEAFDKMQAQMANVEEDNQVTIDYVPQLAILKSKLPVAQQDSLTLIETELANAGSTSDKIGAIQQAVAFWDRQRTVGPQAYYAQEIAALESTQENWTEAGDKSLVAFKLNQDSILQVYFSDKTLFAYEKAVELAPENLNSKVNLARTYIDVKKEVMRGVFMLREVVAEDSLHVPANLLLGRLSVFSRQMDKAVARLEKVIKKEPDNSEALYYLGEAHLGLGNKETSLKYFKQCREIVQNPAFRAELDNYINSIIN